MPSTHYFPVTQLFNPNILGFDEGRIKHLHPSFFRQTTEYVRRNDACHELGTAPNCCGHDASQLNI